MMLQAMLLAGLSLSLSPSPEHPEVDLPAYCELVEQDVDRSLVDHYKATQKVDTTTIRTRVGKKRWRVTYRENEFAWKDPAAAAKAGLELEQWLVLRVDPQFKLRLYWLIRTLEAHGVRVGITSLFRDDYRQSLITEGTRASVGYSLHGGSKFNSIGYAADLVALAATRATQLARNNRVWGLIDRFGPKFGVVRPIPRDPAHVVLIERPKLVGTQVASSKYKGKKVRLAKMHKHKHSKKRYAHAT